jgi:2-polyprenyl-3-methyl-5-hydroxy-6-metoxy-1,4-benzoquinol methylase
MRKPRTLRTIKAEIRRSAAAWLLKIEHFGKAHEYFLKALKALPHDVRIHKGLARSSAGLGDFNEAILRLEIAARLSPHDADVQDWLAKYYAKNGYKKEAEQHAFQALCLEPDLDEPFLSVLLREREDADELSALHSEVRKISVKSTQNYGRYGFYQGFERLLLPGQRPIEGRLDSYGLTKFLKPNTMALDIGCNCGFLSLGIAPQIAHITGVDIDSRMIDIARLVARYLRLEERTQFSVGKFEEFEKENISKERRFDLIIATAVHMHVRHGIEEFASVISKLLNFEGLVLLESQDIRTTDWDFPDKVLRFSGTTFKEISRGVTLDENNIPRIHVLLQRTG